MLGEDLPGLVVCDNFKGLVTEKVLGLLDKNNAHVLKSPPNTTDRLQLMDINFQ